MRYTIEKENSVKELAKSGKTLEYIMAITGLPPKVIWGWCPELRPHEDIIKQSVKQRFHFIYPDLEAKISTAFSPFITPDISEDDWENINKVIYNVLAEEALYVFKNAIIDPPNFGDVKKLSEERFLDYIKKFWTEDSEYCKHYNLKANYIKMMRNSVHYWSPLKNKKVKDITKGDIEVINENLSAKGLSASRISSVLKVGLIPLKQAYKDGLTLLKTYEYQLPKVFRRDKTIPSSILLKVMNHKWKSQESYLANLLACQTRMEMQEVRALTLQDVYTGGYIITNNIINNHIVKKNPNIRKIKVSQLLIDCILKYTSTSPFKDFKKTDYVFYSINRNIPATGKTWTKDLKEVCSLYMDDVRHVEFSMWH